MVGWLILAGLLACENDLGDGEDTAGGGTDDTDVTDADTDTDTDTDTDVTDTDTDVTDTDTDVTDTDTDTLASSEPVVVDFTAAAAFESGLTDAAVDETSGRASSAPLHVLAASGDGSDGVYDGSATLAAGTWQFTELTVPAGGLTFDGDTVLRVQGDLDATAGDIDVLGSLTVVVGGDWTQACTSVEAWAVNVEVHGANGLQILCPVGSPGFGELAASRLTDQNAGDVEIWVDGPLVVQEGYIYSLGPEGPAAGDAGETRIATSGDITLQNSGYIQGVVSAQGLAGVAPPRVTVRTTGALVMTTDSYIQGAGARFLGPGATVTVRTEQGVHLDGSSYVQGGYSADCDVMTEGDVELLDYSYIQTGRHERTDQVTQVTAASLSLLTGGTITGGAAQIGTYPGGDVVLDISGDVLVDGGTEYSSISAGNGLCDTGGNLTLRAEGSLTVREGGLGSGDSRDDFVTSCTGTLAGDVTLSTVGPQTFVDPNGFVTARTGVLTQTEDPTLDLPPIDVGLSGRPAVVSVPQSARTALVDVAVTGDPQISVQISADGSTDSWVPAADVVGQSLPDGWRYRIEVPWTLFSGSTVDDVTFTFTP